jgi:hypothetical protein
MTVEEYRDKYNDAYLVSKAKSGCNKCLSTGRRGYKTVVKGSERDRIPIVCQCVITKEIAEEKKKSEQIVSVTEENALPASFATMDGK